MNISIFLLCYNESALIPHTVKHYRKYIPNCIITIYDNESTDNSVNLAKSLGCNVISWNSKNILDEFKITNIKNNCWKGCKGWVIVADMDEFLHVTEQQLNYEFLQGTSILTVKGLDIIGESRTLDLSDIDLQQLTKFQDCPSESKRLCFFREHLNQINFDLGAHNCRPNGIIKFSNDVYLNKHMNFLGMEYYVDKTNKRYARSKKMRTRQISTHYTDDIEQAKAIYLNALNNATEL